MFDNLLWRPGAAVLAALVLAGLPNAGYAKDSVLFTVSYADLNLNTQAGIDRLYYRLRKVSRDACNVRSMRESGSLRATRQSRECYDAAMKAAMNQLNAKTVASLASRDTGLTRKAPTRRPM